MYLHQTCVLVKVLMDIYLINHEIVRFSVFLSTLKMVNDPIFVSGFFSAIFVFKHFNKHIILYIVIC